MKKFRKRNLAWIVPVSVIALIVLAFFIYTGHYYHADAEALSALESDDSVTVIKTDFGWMFDGPSDELSEQICRMYLTHPGIDAQGIINKMELRSHGL